MGITKKILLLTLFQGLVCQRWEFPTEIIGLIGSCVEIPSTFYPQMSSTTSSTVWYLLRDKEYTQIFNSEGSSSIINDYRNRTSGVPGSNSCSLRIDPVRSDDGDQYYFPGIAEDQDTNAWSKQGQRRLQLHVKDTPNMPELTGNGEMVEGHPENVSCSVVHSCGSNPPSLKWDKPGQTERRSEDQSGGKWREMSTIRYIPSHEDDKTQIQCTATYQNGRTSFKAGILNIKYAPKDVTVSLPKNEEFLKGSDVPLTCSSRSNPPPHRYKWYRGNSKSKLKYENQRVRALNISKDTKPYSCVAINNVGRAESPLTWIPVRYAATGVQVVVNHPTEEDTELMCAFMSSNPNVTHYTWIKDGDSLMNKTEQILVLDSDGDKSGSYSCTAHSTAGSSTSAELVFTESNTNENPTGIHSILFPILGILAGVILLIVIAFFYKRTKACKTSSTCESSQQPEAMYMDLVKTEISIDYDTVKPPFLTQPTDDGRDLHSENHYENLQRPE